MITNDYNDYKWKCKEMTTSGSVKKSHRVRYVIEYTVKVCIGYIIEWK